MWPSSLHSSAQSPRTSTSSVSQEDFEKPQPMTTTCQKHAAQPTPQLDALIHESSNKERIETLRTLLADIVDDEHCFKCATEAAARALFAYLKDLRDAKRSGAFSNEDKKVLKKEFKLLMKGVKRDIKSTSRTKS